MSASGDRDQAGNAELYDLHRAVLAIGGDLDLDRTLRRILRTAARPEAPVTRLSARWTSVRPGGRLQAMSDRRDVGATYVEGLVTGPTGERAQVEFHMDSGAALSVLPDEVWRKLELKPKRAELFQLADGTVIERDISECHIRLPQGDAHTPVILGKPGDVALLGVITLEELGLVLDPFERKLRRRRHYLLHVAAVPSPASEGGADAART